MATSPGEGAGATFVVRLPIRPADDFVPEPAMSAKNHRAA
jgi:hypothetical protein